MPDTESVVRSLPIWSGEIELVPLAGGLTNLNYKVTDGDRSFAVRTGTDDPALGIDRANELACTRIAAEHGIAPRIEHGAAGVLVCDYVESTTLTPELIASEPMVDRIAVTIRAIHDLGTEVTGHLSYFSPFQVARTYIRHAQRHGLVLPGGDALLTEVAELNIRYAELLDMPDRHGIYKREAHAHLLGDLVRRRHLRGPGTPAGARIPA